MSRFELLATDPGSSARRGRLRLERAVVETPVFMPVGTQGSVKTMSQDEVRDLGFRLILGNTYHLHLRPGEELVRRAGGLHRFIGWDGAILTDSGGYQVFSLEGMRKLSEEGVEFRSHVDGSRRFFSPEGVVDIQLALGSDILMVLDECPPHGAERSYLEASMERTHRWASRCREQWLRRRAAEPGVHGELFGIVQGGTHLDLRTRSAAAITELDFPGNAIGGVSVGEPKGLMYEVTRHTARLLPAGKPRYLMGVGTPEDILESVAAGVDMFDCVLPTRMGRNGTVFTSGGRRNIKNARFAEEFGPLDPDCPGWCCRNHSAAYLRHLYRAGEVLALRVLTYHNLAFYARLMDGIRSALESGMFPEFRDAFMARIREGEAAGGG